jgi:hypothetical protein
MVVRFKRYLVNDDQGFQMPFVRGIIPADWTVKGGVVWRMALGPPDLMRFHWGDAQDIRAIDSYPYVRFVWENPDSPLARRLNVPGRVLGHCIVMEPPADQFDAIDKVIVGMFRPDLKQAQVVSKEKLPKVAKANYDELAKNLGPQFAIEVWAGRETFEYQLHGQTVQELVSLVFAESMFRPSGNRGWDISYATSERAPKGTLDKLQPISMVIFRSLQLNPAWSQQLAQLIEKRQAAERQQQEETFDRIEARIRAQSEANDEEHANYWQHSEDLNRQSENFADYQREVSPWKDNEGNSYKLPTQYSYAWSGADGQIIMSNDAGYNPNADPDLTPTNWAPMQPSHN